MKKQIKIFYAGVSKSLPELEKEVNDFLLTKQDKLVIDIRHSESMSNDAYSTSIMVIYYI